MVDASYEKFLLELIFGTKPFSLFISDLGFCRFSYLFVVAFLIPPRILMQYYEIVLIVYLVNLQIATGENCMVHS